HPVDGDTRLLEGPPRRRTDRANAAPAGPEPAGLEPALGHPARHGSHAVDAREQHPVVPCPAGRRAEGPAEDLSGGPAESPFGDPVAVSTEDPVQGPVDGAPVIERLDPDRRD